ncbi:hypothetical protein HDU98_005299 [Podochytrium sp. JEL0797]|nr:hypothetical protein HDU98_005299 [Podochytrium sp. JEL0797]
MRELHCATVENRVDDRGVSVVVSVTRATRSVSGEVSGSGGKKGVSSSIQKGLFNRDAEVTPPPHASASLSRPSTPISMIEIPRLVDSIAMEKVDPESGVEFVRIEWSDAGMEMHVPEGSGFEGWRMGGRVVQGGPSGVGGVAHGSEFDSDTGDEDDNDAMDLDVEWDNVGVAAPTGKQDPATQLSSIYTSTRRTWVRKDLIQRAFPHVVEEWKHTQAMKGWSSAALNPNEALQQQQQQQQQLQVQSPNKSQPKPFFANRPASPSVEKDDPPPPPFAPAAAAAAPPVVVPRPFGEAKAVWVSNGNDPFDSDDEDKSPVPRKRRVAKEREKNMHPPPAPRKKKAFYFNNERNPGPPTSPGGMGF